MSISVLIVLIFFILVGYFAYYNAQESRNSPLAIFPGKQDMQKIHTNNFELFKEIVQTNNLGRPDVFEDLIVLPQFGRGLGFTAIVEDDKYNIFDEKIFLQPSIAASPEFLVVFEAKKYDVSNRPELFKYRPRSQQWIGIYEYEKLSIVYIVTDEGRFNTVTSFIFEFNWVEGQKNVCLVFACHMDDLNIAERIKKMCKNLKYPTNNCTMEFIEKQHKYTTLFSMGKGGILDFTGGKRRYPSSDLPAQKTEKF